MPHTNSTEQVNNNKLVGHISFPEVLCQIVANLCINPGTQACTHWLLASLQQFSVHSRLWWVLFQSCHPDTGRQVPTYSPGFCTSTKFAPQLPTSSKDRWKPPTRQPLEQHYGKATPAFAQPALGKEREREKELLVSPVSERRKEGAHQEADIPCRWRARKQPGAGSLEVPSCCLRCCCRCPRSISASPSSPPALCEPERRSPQNYHLEKRRQCRCWAARTARPARGARSGSGTGAGGQSAAESWGEGSGRGQPRGRARKGGESY